MKILQEYSAFTNEDGLTKEEKKIYKGKLSRNLIVHIESTQ